MARQPQTKPSTAASKRALDTMRATAAEKHAKRVKEAGEELEPGGGEGGDPTGLTTQLDTSVAGGAEETTAGDMPDYTAEPDPSSAERIADRTMLKGKKSWMGGGGFRFEYDPAKPDRIIIDGRAYADGANGGKINIAKILAKYREEGDYTGRVTPRTTSPALMQSARELAAEYLAKYKAEDDAQTTPPEREPFVMGPAAETDMPEQPPAEGSLESTLHTLFGVGTSQRPPAPGMGQFTVDVGKSLQQTPIGAALSGRMNEVPSRFVRGAGPAGGAVADAMGMSEPAGAGRVLGVSTNLRTFLNDLFK